MKCTDCRRLDVLEHLSHSRLGFGRCPDDPRHVFKAMGYERDCAKFVQMTEEQKEARRNAWLLKKNPPVRAKEEKTDESGN